MFANSSKYVNPPFLSSNSVDMDNNNINDNGEEPPPDISSGQHDSNSNKHRFHNNKCESR